MDVLRDQGFDVGFGIDPKDKNKLGDEDDPRIAGRDLTDGNEEGGRRAMENLLQKDPNINVVHTINEPAGEGAHAALVAAGREDQALIVSIDGSCKGMDDVEKGIFAADATQYPGKMAALGVKAVASVGAGEKPPSLPEGEDFLDTGTRLVTAEPVKGLESQSVEEGRKACWGG